mmetsp:Transcript_18648/g.33715  ORF Transcript_18648/g.33715 Transcript_18648/m.33715 type:complete len:212 (-) Transcript_18648:1405-2040(-)
METLDELLARLCLTQYSENFASKSLKIEDMIPMSVSELNDMLGNLGILKGHAIKFVMAVLKLKSAYKTSESARADAPRPPPPPPRPTDNDVLDIEGSDSSEDKDSEGDVEVDVEAPKSVASVASDPSAVSGDNPEESIDASQDVIKPSGNISQDSPSPSESDTEASALRRLSEADYEELRKAVESFVKVDIGPYREIVEEIGQLQRALVKH